MINEEIVGTDIDRHWVLNGGMEGDENVEPVEGDLSLVRGSDNLSQAIYLRLTSLIDELPTGEKFNNLWWAYNNYGSYTKSYLGKNQNDYTRHMLTQEISDTLESDPRLEKVTVELIDWTPNAIGVDILAQVYNGRTFHEYFIFSNLERFNEQVNNPVYTNTYIDTREDGFYGKIGEFLSVFCYVKDSDDNRVPVGKVSLSIGDYLVQEEGLRNPQRLAESGTEHPGSCIFKFRIPKFIKEGVHKLVFKYHGIRGYNSCVHEAKLHIGDRIQTRTKFVYPVKDRPWYFANDYDYFRDPVVHVTDANRYDVNQGEVKYYLSDRNSLDHIIFIEFPIIYHVNRLIKNQCYMRVRHEVLDYSTQFIFKVNYMFKQGDIFELVGPHGQHIDWLHCDRVHANVRGDDGEMYESWIYMLVSTEVKYPYADVDEDGNRLKSRRNNDIDALRSGHNCDITMEVVE